MTQAQLYRAEARAWRFVAESVDAGATGATFDYVFPREIERAMDKRMDVWFRESQFTQPAAVALGRPATTLAMLFMALEAEDDARAVRKAA